MITYFINSLVQCYTGDCPKCACSVKLRGWVRVRVRARIVEHRETEPQEFVCKFASLRAWGCVSV